MKGTIKQKAAKGILWNAIQVFGGQFSTFLVFIIMARLLNPSDYGVVAVSSVYLAFVGLLVDQGLSAAVVQRSDIKQEHLDTAFWTNVITGGALTLVSWILSPYIALFFHEPAVQPIVSWLSLSFVLSGLNSTQQAILRRNLNFKPLATRTLFSNIVGGVSGVTLAFLGFGVWSIVAQRLLQGLTGCIVLWSVNSWRPSFRFSKEHFWELYSFGMNQVGVNLLGFLNRRSDDLLIGYFLGPQQLGYYSVAYRLLLVMTNVLTQVISSVALPAFSRLQSQPEKIKEGFYLTTRLTSFIAFPSFVMVAALAPELVKVLFTEKWSNSIPVMQVLSMIGILHSVSYFNSTVMMALGKPAWRLGLALLNVSLNVPAFLIAVHWGILAVATAYVVRGYLVYLPSVWILNLLLPIEPWKYISRFIPPLIASVLMAAAISLERMVLSGVFPDIVILVIAIMTGVIVYLGTLNLMSPSSIREVISLAKDMGSTKKKKPMISIDPLD